MAEQFSEFFHRGDTFGLGICNGCQMMSNLKAIIPGAQAWPKFTRNKSEQFEARFAMVEVMDTPSIFLQGMAGTQAAIAIAHGEGFADFSTTGDIAQANIAMAGFITIWSSAKTKPMESILTLNTGWLETTAIFLPDKHLFRNSALFGLAILFASTTLSRRNNCPIPTISTTIP